MIMAKLKKIIPLILMIISVFLIAGSVGFCADNTVSINAEFDVIKTSSKSKFDIGVKFDPRWPLENPPPVAGSKSPTLRQQNGCKLIQFLF